MRLRGRIATWEKRLVTKPASLADGLAIDVLPPGQSLE